MPWLQEIGRVYCFLHSRVGRAAGIVAFTLTIAMPLAAHEDAQFHNDRQPVYSGPGYEGGLGGDPPLNFPSAGVQLMSWIPVTAFDLNFTSASVVESYVSASGREYALLGLSGGVGFAEVTNPAAAHIVTGPGFGGVITGLTSLWRDIRTYQTYAYAVSEAGGGIQVMSLAQIDNGVVTLVRSITTPGTTATHTIHVNRDSGFLYRSGGSTALGVRIYSLADPSNPAHVATVLPGRYVHEAQAVTFSSGPYAGKEILFCCSNANSGGGSPGVDILDVTNKAAPQTLSSISYPGAQFSHQAWLSPDGHYLFHNDELDEPRVFTPTTTRVFDVSNLSAPFLAGTFSNGGTAIDHNLYTKNNLVFESNYRSGLRVWDASNPLAPVEVAYFDTYPEDDTPNFNGLWDNDPYLPSGTVLGSDIEKGLFVWRIAQPQLLVSLPNGPPSLLRPDGDTLRVQITPTNGGALVPGSASLYYATGASFTAAPLVPLGGEFFDAVFPAFNCGQRVQWYVAADSAAGIPARSPVSAPVAAYTSLAAFAKQLVFSDDMESGIGWTAGAPGDNATTGIWELIDPEGTAAQPENDHTPDAGTFCWVTGQGAEGGQVGDNDVDGGHTTLTVMLDLSAFERPYISYWRWYSNNRGDNASSDTFVIDLSGDGGAIWRNVEIVGPAGVGTTGGWFEHGFFVSDVWEEPVSTALLRFVASDLGGGSVVEAAIDDLEAAELVCASPCAIDLNCDGLANNFDIDPFILALVDVSAYHALYPSCPISRADANGDGVVNNFDIDSFVACVLGGP